ncbi:MAG TPA: Wzz/FepE/Etk N-terminal domain-containing protein [Solirubrobacteraceae bacterium]|nr:Wzz/FepE/Etk N-terminal domain-containing protein [Solirubrobacteraceae bacterium]
MDDAWPRAGGGSSWLRPRTEAQGAIRYLDTIRERWWVVVLTTILALGAAVIYVSVAHTRYQAEADVLVTPVSGTESATSGLGLITESNDPTQTVSTAARLISTDAVAAEAIHRLRLSGTPQSLLGDVKVEPIAQSSLVAVTAERGSAAEAARVANGFAQASIEVATSQLHAAIAARLPALRGKLAGLPSSQQSGAGTLGERVAALEALAASPDPTLRVAASATVPTSPSSPKKKLALIAGLIAGLILGLGAAFSSQALDPRLRREEQLRELFRLPLLARIPRVTTTRGEGPLVPARLSPAATEAFRTMRATLAATAGENVRSILVTSSSEAEGKSSTAINLAESLALAGRRTLLIEGDLRRPTIAQALGLHPGLGGIGSVLVNDVSMEDAILTTDAYGHNLGFLLVERKAIALADQLSLPTARKLVEEAEALAEIVVIDSPPLTQVIDALPIAQEVDAVVIVARLGASRLNRLEALGELLAQGGVKPTGLVMVGQEFTANAYYGGVAAMESSAA